MKISWAAIYTRCSEAIERERDWEIESSMCDRRMCHAQSFETQSKKLGKRTEDGTCTKKGLIMEKCVATSSLLSEHTQIHTFIQWTALENMTFALPMCLPCTSWYCTEFKLWKRQIPSNARCILHCQHVHVCVWNPMKWHKSFRDIEFGWME